MAEYAGHSISASVLYARNFREALLKTGMSILRGKPGYNPVLDFARSTAAGLAALPRRLEYRFLYDARGSALFERITRQPEYYLTRTETSILEANAGHIREITGPVALVELGSRKLGKNRIPAARLAFPGASRQLYTCRCQYKRPAQGLPHYNQIRFRRSGSRSECGLL